MPELTIDLSWQSIHLLKELERWGIYGVSIEEIASRFVDQKLVEMAQAGHLKLVKQDTLSIEVRKRMQEPFKR